YKTLLKLMLSMPRGYFNKYTRQSNLPYQNLIKLTVGNGVVSTVNSALPPLQPLIILTLAVFS
ncbi:MAG TPA: hypothetical protein PK633_06120, partial [Agitococcus sp.]|nr:hypothetical protein [Agitococcus sp.]